MYQATLDKCMNKYSPSIMPHYSVSFIAFLNLGFLQPSVASFKKKKGIKTWSQYETNPFKVL